MFSLRIATAAGLLVASTGFAQTAPSVPVPLSGHEVFPGITVANLTLGATFAGWTTLDSSAWYPIDQNSGGTWFASIAYQGAAREPGRAVDMEGGYLSVEVTGVRYTAEVVGGEVRWPAGAEPEWPCTAPEGYWVARFDAEVATTDGEPVARLSGCLDDIRWDPDRPSENVPTIWGRIEPAVP